LQKNALFLDLLARELAHNETIAPAELIALRAGQPNNLFVLPIERFRRQPLLWEKVISPLLGILLVAQKPLSRQSLGNLLQVEDDLLTEGLLALGDLLLADSEQGYTLFHHALREYLQQDGQQRAALFSQEEEAQWHNRLARWCERGMPEQIWHDSE